MVTKKKLLSLIMVVLIILGSLPMASILAEEVLQPLETTNPSLEVTKTADKREFLKVGETITYTYIVKNTGNVNISGPFLVTDTKIDTIDTSSAPENLEPGEEFSLIGTYKVNQEDIIEAHIYNRVDVIGILKMPHGEERVVDWDDTAVHLGPSLKIEKSADKKEFSAIGEKITYNYTVTHIGHEETLYGSTNGPAPGVFVLNDDKIGEISTENINSLESGESFTLTGEYIVSQEDIDAGFVRNKVKVQGSYLDFPNDPIESETELTIPAKKKVIPEDDYKENPSLELKKTADKEDFSKIGEKITYSYLIRNAGNTLVRGDFYGSEDQSFRLEDNKIGKIDTSLKPIELEPGKSFIVTAEYKVVQSDIDEGKVTNIAKVTGISGNDYLEDVDSLTILAKKKVEPEKPVEPPIEDKLNMEDHFQYITGYPDNTVRPDGLITREEVAAVFYRLLADDYRESIKTSEHNFKDIKEGRWSAQAIATLSNAKIILGYEDNSFRPGNSITRAEVATIASRFDNLTPFTSNEFSDIENHWANKCINSAAKKGWINGNPDGTFKPNQYIKRAEFVTLVNNVLNRRVKKENILPNAKQFSDLLETKWYYASMQEAINSHHYIRKEDGFEEWTEIYYPKMDM